MQHDLPQTFSDSQDEIQDIIPLGWPSGAFMPSSQGGNCPIRHLDGKKKNLLEIILGPYLNVGQESFLAVTLQHFFDPNATRWQTLYDGLCVTGYKSSPFADRVKHIWDRVKTLPLLYFEETTIDPENGVQTTHTKLNDNTGSYYNVHIAVSGPLDVITNQEETARINSLPQLDSLHLLPPKTPLRDLEYRNTCLSGFRSIVDGKQNLEQCVLPLELFAYIRSYLQYLSRLPNLCDLELTAPVCFDLLHILTNPVFASSSNVFLEGFINSLSTITSLRILTIPASLITSKVIRCISGLPKLRMLKIKPVPKVDSVVRLWSALEEAGIVIQSTEHFKCLSFLDLDPDNPEVRCFPVDEAEKAFSRENRLRLKAILPITFFCRDPIENEYPTIMNAEITSDIKS